MRVPVITAQLVLHPMNGYIHDKETEIWSQVSDKWLQIRSLDEQSPLLLTGAVGAAD